jgi:hypothetical protein
MSDNYFNFSNHEMQLSCTTDDNGVIRVAMNGNLGDGYHDVFREWSQTVKDAMVAASKRDPERVLCVADLTGPVIVADGETMKLLIDLFRFNKNYVTRTGVFGASAITRHLIDIALKVVRRDNMKVCATEEEAEAWVHQGKKPEQQG